MRIDLGGIQILMPQDLLQRAHVHAALQHQRGRCVAKLMGGILAGVQPRPQQGFKLPAGTEKILSPVRFLFPHGAGRVRDDGPEPKSRIRQELLLLAAMLVFFGVLSLALV